MKKLFFAVFLFLIVSCGSGENSNTSSNNDSTSQQGNSGGSDIIGMDTMRMDTAGSSATDSGR